MNATTSPWITDERSAEDTPLATRAYAPLTLRLALGTLFLAHGLAKIFLFTLPGTVRFFESVGFPGALVYPVLAVELVAGTLLLAGVYTRWAALALVPVMIGATAVHAPNGWLFTQPNGGWEFPVFVGAAAFALFLLDDDGAFSLTRTKLLRD